MSKVFFADNVEKIVHKIDEDILSGKVGLKVHFGEEGNETFLDASKAKEVYNQIIDLGYEGNLVECNVLYQGSRTNREDHIQIAREHGFTFADIDILDGELGEADMQLDVEGGNIDQAKVGEGLKDYKSLVVLSHVKGHIPAGFGGAIKNVGMGLGARGGKLHMHSDVSPSINQSACVGCGKCVRNCEPDAITLSEGKAEIDQEKCIGCAMCIAVCPEKAVNIPWGGSTHKQLQEKIVDYFRGIVDYLDRNLFYINVLKNITRDCDCQGKSMEPMMEDVGVLASKDPVAIEKASLDLIRERVGEKFDDITTVDNDHIIEYAHKRQLGSINYKLIKI